jgi:insertion element IS1 protein InsB
VLELDELWSFVLSKKNKRWVWLAKARHTARKASPMRLETVAKRLAVCCGVEFRKPIVGFVFTDFWEAYTNVIPPEHHRAVGIDSGETAHIERWNNTLRQRLARFTRQSLAFSKSDFRHEGCLRLFLHRFNYEIIL